ncbi:class I SAM-dependent methyltransferase [Elioraea thermophila]|uniref:class I SAM-dependent methyltransferase n=1 Tax=Elioraea thermophila TaxID=2185104 RepID=UPI001300A4A3|nr:class I SAM-dependent methyltransferase [Elioraea thermophila]
MPDQSSPDRLPHYEFGRNWAEFAARLNEEAIAEAVRGLERLLPREEVEGRSVLDVGCGSGLSALAFLRLGAASVHAIDLDADSVETTRRVLGLHAAGKACQVERRSVFDLDRLPRFDIVYSWGVLHHTGDLDRAFRAAAAKVEPGGSLAVALYRRTPLCGFWRLEKRLYTAAPQPIRRGFEALYVAAFRLALAIRGRSFAEYVARYPERNRGMSFRTDVKDWLGGYPYESISEAETLRLAEACGLEPVRRFCRPPGLGLFGSGCDEYVFRAHA